MVHHPPSLDTLVDLENRHEKLLQRLVELDQRVETVLKQCQSGREPVVTGAKGAFVKEEAE